ncbi:hypothetical protein HYH03_017301 [Edaphochlamys debaryana]|uniref:DNA mismatch repair protein MSH3 n=1 Tax=Edaphochlamys debaryana TaxID=47281 RepID=A0A835XJB3_9CHLO|nr:hypothetical protein HYH03_017301 [Edaphochlamys debaryana]|eukprot:KAG2483848.1 hypothetical protein HYH03_017301 [Edaphochlamys debaryana]
MSGKGAKKGAQGGSAQKSISAFFKAAGGTGQAHARAQAASRENDPPGPPHGNEDAIETAPPAKRRRTDVAPVSAGRKGSRASGDPRQAAKQQPVVEDTVDLIDLASSQDPDQDAPPAGSGAAAEQPSLAQTEGATAADANDGGGGAREGVGADGGGQARDGGGGQGAATVTAAAAVAVPPAAVTAAAGGGATPANGLQRLLAASRRRAGAATPAAATPASAAAAAATPLTAPPPPPLPSLAATPMPAKLTPAQRERARHKLAQENSRRGGGATVDATAAAGGGGGGSAAKLTPLEQQVVALKAQYPGTILVVEVGYKMRFFGEDAEVAKAVCGIGAYVDHSFLTASFPVARLPIYIRRLCRAGHRVGVVRQTETAALKAAGSNRSAPFERAVTALYTAATLEAGRRADKIGEEGALDELQDLPSAAPAGGSAHMLFVAEGPPPAAAAAAAAAGMKAGAAAGGAAAETQLGVLCVDLAGGDIVYGICGDDVSRGGVTSSRPSGASALDELEALLISTAPVEIVTVGPLASTAARRLLQHYLSSAPGCRLERVDQPSQAVGTAIGTVRGPDQEEVEEADQEDSPAKGKGGKKGKGSKGKGGRGAGTKRSAAAAGREPVSSAATEAAATSGGGGGAGGGGGGGDWLAAVRQEVTQFFAARPAAAAADDGDEGPGSGPGGGAAGGAYGTAESPMARLAAALPPAVLLATWAAVRHLRSFGLTTMLRVRSCWRPLTETSTAATDAGANRRTALLQTLNLGPNALRQLEIVSAGGEEGSGGGGGAGGGDGEGTLLRLMDRTATPFGSRLLRRWLVAPLARRELILSRQEAVAELLEAVNDGKAPLSHLPRALSRLPDIERGLTRALHRTASPAEFVGTARALQQFRVDLHLPPLPDPAEDQPLTANHQLPSTAGGDAAAGLASLEAAVASPLLRRLLRAVGGCGLAAAVAGLLAPIDTKAAAANDFGSMFVDRSRFRGVWAAKDAVRAAEEHLECLLPSLARAAGLPAVAYTTIQNQGTHLVEVPVDAERRVPKAWHKVCSTKKFHRYHPPEVLSGLQTLNVSQERLAAAQRAAWASYLTSFEPAYPAALEAARAAAHLDALCSLASLAATPGYCRPVFLPEPTDPPPTANRQTVGGAGGAAGGGEAMEVDSAAAAAPAGPGGSADGGGGGSGTPPVGLESGAEAGTGGRAEAGASISGGGGGAVLRAVGARHPMLDARLSGAMPSGRGRRRAGGGGGGGGVASGGAAAAVPNDVFLGGACGGGGGGAGPAEAEPAAGTDGGGDGGGGGGGGGVRCLVVTGPNMGGKSCFTRTAALLVVMAQVGSYVPADSLHLTVFDGVFTRMGASDNILLGRSTFFEEMSDTSALLAQATPRSLVVLDELGRGTATYDGLAVASAVLSYLLHEVRCLVLFVTHYPELAAVAARWPRLAAACHMGFVREEGGAEGEGEEAEEDGEGRQEEAEAMEVDGGGDGGSTGVGGGAAAGGRLRRPQSEGLPPRITFLYRLLPGAADESFGLNVAQMAGLPLPLVERAAQVAAGMRRRLPRGTEEGAGAEAVGEGPRGTEEEGEGATEGAAPEGTGPAADTEAGAGAVLRSIKAVVLGTQSEGSRPSAEGEAEAQGEAQVEGEGTAEGARARLLALQGEARRLLGGPGPGAGAGSE